jgi:hypothetical protein
MEEEEYFRRRMEKAERDSVVALLCLAGAIVLVIAAVVWQALTC